ncbi:MAG: hypothetical protein WD768_17205 [Phycisphaeraceae bacterium]
MIMKRTENVADFGPKLSWEEICEQHPSEWVLLVDLDSTEQHEVTAGRVVWYGDSNDEAYERGADLEAPEAAVLFTGPLRTDVKFLL